jgi:hypothetical protein
MFQLVADAKNMAHSFEQMPKRQATPRGEHIIAKAPVLKIPPYHYQQAVRDEAIKRAFNQTILPAYHQKDGEKKGRARFTLILTWSES